MRHTSIGIRSKEDCGRQEMFDIRCGKGHIEYYILISNFKQQYTHVLLLWYLNDYKIGLIFAAQHFFIGGNIMTSEPPSVSKNSKENTSSGIETASLY